MAQTTALVTKLKNEVSNLRASRLKAKAKEKGKRGVKILADVVVIGGTGLAAGFVQGKYGAVKIPKTNVPADLALAAVLYGYSVYEGGSHAHTVNNIAHGLLTSHLVAIGRGAGKKSRASAGKPPLVEGAQDRDLADKLDGLADGGGTLSDEDLIAVAKGQ